MSEAVGGRTRSSLGGTFLSRPSSARPRHSRYLVTCLAMLSASIHTLSRKARVIVRVCGSRGLQKRHQTPAASPCPGHGFLLALCARSPEISLVFERFATYSASYSSSTVLEASNQLTKLSIPDVACSPPIVCMVCRSTMSWYHRSAPRPAHTRAMPKKNVRRYDNIPLPFARHVSSFCAHLPSVRALVE